VPNTAHTFDDGAAYEQFMAQWSRALGQSFLRWVDPPANALWLDVGCGTGILTELVLESFTPAAVTGIDCAEAQIAHARQQGLAQRADLRVADAQSLPFSDGSFDVVASALTINFIPDRDLAVAEMRRVARSAGLVAGCVWDFASELSPSWPLRAGMRSIGLHVPDVPGASETSLAALSALFVRIGFSDVEVTSIEVRGEFADFEEFWCAQTPNYARTTKIIAELGEGDRAMLLNAVRARAPFLSDGRIEYSARANAIKARRPPSLLASEPIT
jgi:ubiquinone/menaquinone biosynthesis C-methylase UbiE